MTTVCTHTDGDQHCGKAWPHQDHSWQLEPTPWDIWWNCPGSDEGGAKPIRCEQCEPSSAPPEPASPQRRAVEGGG